MPPSWRPLVRWMRIEQSGKEMRMKEREGTDGPRLTNTWRPSIGCLSRTLGSQFGRWVQITAPRVSTVFLREGKRVKWQLLASDRVCTREERILIDWLGSFETTVLQGHSSNILLI